MWRGGNKGAYYRCSNQTERRLLDEERQLRCELGGVKISTVEAHLIASLAVLCSDEEILERAAQEVTKLASIKNVPRTKRDIRSIREQIRRLTHAYELGAYEERRALLLEVFDTKYWPYVRRQHTPNC
jgi:hypothetical protein